MKRVVEHMAHRAFTVTQSDKVWVTNITSIRTYKGWLYLPMDLFSRKIIGWSMKSTLAKEIVLGLQLITVWRRAPVNEVIIHSEHGSKFSRDEWECFCAAYKLYIPGMSDEVIVMTMQQSNLF